MFSLNFVAFNKNFYDAQFKANDTAEILQSYGISAADLKSARDAVIDYLSGKSDTLEISFFTAAELQHMADVKAVFGTVRILGLVLMLSGAGILAFLLILSKGRLWRSAALGGGIFLGLIALVGLMLALNFDFAFTAFHHLVFPQGNWQFDGGSLMLVMFPESFFTSAAFIIAGIGAVFAVILSVASLTIAQRKHY